MNGIKHVGRDRVERDRIDFDLEYSDRRLRVREGFKVYKVS